MNTDSNNYHAFAQILSSILKNRQQHNAPKTEFYKTIALPKIQEIFEQWATIKFETFLTIISPSYIKSLLQNQQTTLFDVIATNKTSKNAPTPLNFVNIQTFTTDERNNTNGKLVIYYSYYNSFLGQLLIASTHKGVCYTAFLDNNYSGIKELLLLFPKATFVQKTDTFQESIFNYFLNKQHHSNPIQLHVKGTEFQIKVWKALLNISMGNLTTYGSIAKELKQPTASRAVGTAIGKNPIAVVIPCHRVVQANGNLGGYMWGTVRKAALIGWEISRTSK